MTWDTTKSSYSRSIASIGSCEVYASFGAAIYQCQLIETGLVIYLGLLTRMKSGKPMTPDEVDELQGKFFGNTLGGNIVQVRKLLGTAGKWILDDPMRAALALRNQLTHHWMRERVMLLDTSENRLAVIAELEAATTQIEQADQLLTRRTLQLMKTGGVSLDAIQQEHERLTQLAEQGLPDDEAPPYFVPRER